MDDNTSAIEMVLSDLIVFFIIICCIAGCVTCNYFDNNCDKKYKSKIEQVKLND